jgi:UDP-2,4-diacetamido-2,4,6-trideoxy-beta-L-altropyranose hydrolase
MALGPLLIRADASLATGAGHVMRCLALAQAWREGGGEVSFLMASTTHFVTQRLQIEGFGIRKLTAPIGTPEDASETRNYAFACRPQWIVLDGYHFSATYCALLRSAQWRILRVEDTPGSEFELVDAILNQNVDADSSMYPECSGSELLLGPRFALMRHEFAGAGQIDRRVPAIASKVLMTTGGGDPKNLLPRFVEAVKLCSTKLETKLVTGTAPDKDLSDPSNHDSKNTVELVIGSHNMFSFGTWADIAVSAAGSSCWEFCALGLPAILIDVAENQRPVAETLSKKGIAVHIPGQKASPKRIAEEIDLLTQSPLVREEMSRRGKELVDGRGAYRVLGVLRASGVGLRRATQDDCSLLWTWANDPVTRGKSFSSGTISWDEHRHWFGEKLLDNRSIFLIAEESRTPIAALRVEERDIGIGEISINVSPEARGFGLASHLIRECVQEAAKQLNLTEVHALVKQENMPSRRAFENAGFALSGITGVRGFEAVRYVQQVVLDKPPVEALPALVNEHKRADLRS